MSILSNDYVKLEVLIKEKVGEKFDEQIEDKKVEKKVSTKEAAMFLLAGDLGIKIPKIRQLIEFKPVKIGKIVSDVRDIIGKLISGGLDGEELTDEFKDTYQEWVQTVGIYAGWTEKIKGYKIKTENNKPDISRTGALVDDTGFIKFKVWKKGAVDRFMKEMKRGNVYGLGGVTTAYYEPHDSVTLSAHEGSDIVPDLTLSIDDKNLGKISDLQEYAYGLFKMRHIQMTDKRSYKGCPNEECNKFSRGQKFDNCRACHSKTEMLPNYDFTAICDSDKFEFGVPYFNNFEGVESLDGKAEAYLVITVPKIKEGEVKYMCVGAILNGEKPKKKTTETKEKIDEESVQVCDICAKEETFKDEEEAAEAGWGRIKGILYCPECKKVMEEPTSKAKPEKSKETTKKKKEVKPEVSKKKEPEKKVESETTSELTPQQKMDKVQVKKFMMSKGTFCLTSKLGKKNAVDVYSDAMHITKEEFLFLLEELKNEGFTVFNEKTKTYERLAE